MNSQIEVNSLIDFLENDPIFSHCNTHDLARLVPTIEERSLEKGEILFKENEVCKNIFLIKKGSIELIDLSNSEQFECIDNGAIGIEAALNEDSYFSTAIAITQSVVYVIPNEILSILVKREPRLKTSFLHAIFHHYSNKKLSKIGHHDAFHLQDEHDHHINDVSYKLMNFGWALATIVPILFLLISTYLHFEWHMTMFLTLFSSALMMWMFRLTAEFIPALLVIIGLLLLGVAPPSIALSGYASDTYFMALSVFGMSVVLVNSGLTYRIILLILNLLPKSRFWYGLSLFITGALVTPVIPSTFGRIDMASHLYHDMSETLHYSQKGNAETYLAISAYSGFSLLDHIFLSTNPITFAIFALMPVQIQKEFNWLNWFMAACITGLIMFILYLVFAGLFFKNNELPKLTHQQIRNQLNFLGPLKLKEWSAILGILLFFLGILTMSYHHIEAPWIGLSILYLFLAIGTLKKDDFQKKIDWSFMIFLGALIGLEHVMNYVGLEHWLSYNLSWLGEYMKTDFISFVAILAILIFVIRFFLQNAPTALIFASIFLPLSDSTGTNAWLVGFVILIFSEFWIIPYQSEYYSLFLEQTERFQAFNRKRALLFNMGINLIRVIAVFSSIPYWKWLNIL